MAKVGEGDPRWKVENRTDGKNVNNWHWSEKNLMPFCRNSLKKIFSGVEIPNPHSVELEITGTQDVKGDCTLNNRKGKIFFIYDIEVKVKWKGKTKEGVEGNGTISMIDILVDTDDDFVVKITQEKETNENRILKEVLHATVHPILKEKIKIFLEELRTQNTAESILSPIPGKSETKPKSTSSFDRVVITKGGSSIRSYSTVLSCSISANFLYDIFLDSGKIMALTQAPAQIDSKEGGKFTLFGGQISGEFLNLEPGKRIVQKWRFSDWKDGVYSIVDIQFESDSGSTDLKLTHSEIPSYDFERTTSGWKKYYWSRMKAVFGFTCKVKK